MLNLLRKQPAEAPAHNEALVSLAQYRRDLENAPDDARGNWHDAAINAWTATLQIERMVSQLLQIHDNTAGRDGLEAIDSAIAGLVETAGVLTSEAIRRAEEDAPPYNSEDRWPRYRG